MVGPGQGPEGGAVPLSLEERERLAAIEQALTDDENLAGSFVLFCNPVVNSATRGAAAKRRIWAVLLTLVGMMLAVIGTALVPAVMVEGVAVVLLGCAAIIWGVVKCFAETD